MPEPLIKPSEHKPVGVQPPLEIHDNPPTSSLAQALKQSKAQVDAHAGK